MSKKIYYNYDKINKLGALITLIFGERSNGKSYQVKHKRAVEKYLFGVENYYSSYKCKEKILTNFIEKGSRFMLVRRNKEEIKTYLIEQYFQDVDIMKLTNNRYNTFSIYKNKIYLANYDYETNKTMRGEHIGYVVALSVEQNYAGGSFLDVTDIIFEEFMSRSIYLNSEPAKLMNLYSTVDRKKGTTRLWLIGNSISKVCPYIVDWDLEEIFKTIRQGEIKEKWITTGSYDDDGLEILVKIAVEYCLDTKQTSYAIGKRKNMINGGEWQTDPQPHLSKSYKNYKTLFKIGFQYQQFRFLCRYLMDLDTKDTIWFIHNYNHEFKDDILIFSDIIKEARNWQTDIYNPLIRNERLKRLLKTFTEANICYSTDICGTDFKQVINFTIRK